MCYATGTSFVPRRLHNHVIHASSCSTLELARIPSLGQREGLSFFSSNKKHSSLHVGTCHFLRQSNNANITKLKDAWGMQVRIK
jgi:hypothetical protein